MDDLNTLNSRVIALQSAVSRRMVRRNITTLADEVNTQIEAAITDLEILKVMADEIAARIQLLSEQLEEHING